MSEIYLALKVGPIPQKCNVSNHGIAISVLYQCTITGIMHASLLVLHCMQNGQPHTAIIYTSTSLTSLHFGVHSTFAVDCVIAGLHTNRYYKHLVQHNVIL